MSKTNQTETKELVQFSVEKQIDALSYNIDALVNGANSGAAILANTMLSLKEFEVTMKQMEYAYGIMIKNMDKNILQIKSGSTACEGISNRINKLLDKVLSMDVSSGDENVITVRAELLRATNTQMDALLRIQSLIFNC
jgi:hypothetical protein